MALEDEIKLLDKTVVWKELSTSLSTETEDEELKMLRKAAPPTVRQEQEEEIFPSFFSVDKRNQRCREGRT